MMPANEAAPDPIKELLRPKSLNDLWAMRAEELRERGDELEEDADVFNLNTLNKKIVEMK